MNGYIDQLSGKYSILVSSKNSFIIALSAMAISFVLGVPAAYGLSRYKLPCKKLIMMLFLITPNDPRLTGSDANVFDFHQIKPSKYIRGANYVCKHHHHSLFRFGPAPNVYGMSQGDRRSRKD